MQGVFAAAPVTADAQLLVNLGLVHRDGEWTPYWEGWLDWMRAQGWRRFGWYVWDQGPGLPGDWNGRLAPSHEFIFHFNRQPRKPNKTVESKHAGETLGGGGLRGGRRHGASQDRLRQRDPEPPHPRQRIPDHAPLGRAGRGRIAPGRVPRSTGRGCAGGLLRPRRPGVRTLLRFRHTGDRRGTHRTALLRGGTGPDLLRRCCAAVGVGGGEGWNTREEKFHVRIASSPRLRERKKTYPNIRKVKTQTLTPCLRRLSALVRSGSAGDRYSERRIGDRCSQSFCPYPN